ncbi:CRISPR-associated helicase Cas3' [Granulosicoccaceae sp. 1_MG-2023]|nr:CRISPR-associated helicase Cas3' [Granulosicoccaceae sp. 1_MG-2023]
MDFNAFFAQAYASDTTPFPYQSKLANEAWPDLLNIPTGLGKTAAVTLAWLFKTQEQNCPDTPRRLVWCLPMRVLVEQTEQSIRQWLANLGYQDKVAVHILMGGHQDTMQQSWAGQPEQAAILIGTQDMLLSRALMRGYGMSRYLWPVHYALLNNDALWVFDEVQLMGPALATTAQLEAFRRQYPLGRTSRSLWVSATLDPNWLATVDFRPYVTCGLSVQSLDNEDLAHPVVQNRSQACKILSQARTSLDKITPAKKAKAYIDALATEILEEHQPDTQTLVILNQVERAQGLYQALKKRKPPAELLLLHARFRPAERRAIEEKLKDTKQSADRIVIATQAIEAGVDISSATLFTELAPWSSLVQRFGRCNRYAEYPQARLFCIDIDEEHAPLPYTEESLQQSRSKVDKVLADGGQAGPGQLPATSEPQPFDLVLRRRDFLELFNTDPDLSGQDIDVSPYIRDTGTPQCLVFWRGFDKDPKEQTPPERDELCPAALSHLKQHVKKHGGWRFDHLTEHWQKVSDAQLRPGMTLLLCAGDGGYDNETGFLPGCKGPVATLSPDSNAQSESYTSDRESEIGCFVTLAAHLEDAQSHAAHLCGQLRLNAEDKDAVVTAAARHDWGKAHEAFQNMLKAAAEPPEPDQLWAKSSRSGGRAIYRMNPTTDDQPGVPRPCFRHELASALAWLEQHDAHPQRDLIAYLIAAHHGKVRMGLRALPGENKPGDDRLYARGVWAGDQLPAIATRDGSKLPATTLRLDLMTLGEGPMGASWTERTARLLDQPGPFRLAWLEALVRIADWRASREEQLSANRTEGEH